VRARSDSPDGQAAVIVLGLGAPDYTYTWEVVCFREPDGSWLPAGGLNAPGWHATHDDDKGEVVGVATWWREPPKDARAAVISDGGQTHRVAVCDGFVFFAAWNVRPSVQTLAGSPGEIRLERFEY
jgi:hypothetical protein